MSDANFLMMSDAEVYIMGHLYGNNSSLSSFISALVFNA